MHPSIAFLMVTLGAGAALGAQTSLATAADSARTRVLVAEARAHLAANRLDTAVVLLQAAVESPAAASGVARAEIFLLFAIALHFQGNPSGMGRAVAAALAAAPGIQTPNLAAAAPEVAETLDAQRAAGQVLVRWAVATPPEAQGALRAVYPHQLAREGIEGRVVLRAVVDTSGRVEAGSVRVVEAAHPDFVEPARKALLEGRFHPAETAGRPVPTVVQVPFDFYLGEPPRAAGADTTSTLADRVRDCVRRCKGGERKPVLLSLPNVWELYGAPYPFDETRTREFLLAQFVVEETGAVQGGSITFVAGTARVLESAFRSALMQARFRPAMAGPNAVPARVHLRIEVRREGTGLVTYSVSGP